MKKKQSRHTIGHMYTAVDELFASPTQPLAPEKRRFHLAPKLSGFNELIKGASPCIDDLANVADALNMLDVILGMRFNERRTDEEFRGQTDWDSIDFPDEVRERAVRAVAECIVRGQAGQAFRLRGHEIADVQECIDFYASVVEAISARVFVRAHRLCVQQKNEALHGRTKNPNVHLIEV